MLSYAKLQNKPRVFQSLTGITLSEFEELLPSFEQAWQDYIYTHYISRDDRHKSKYQVDSTTVRVTVQG